MTPSLDLLLVNAPSRQGVYQHLTALAAIEPPVWAGLIATHCRNHGFTVKILDAEAQEMTPEQTAQRIVDERPRLAVFCVYGQQPSASTQCMPGAIATAKALNGYSMLSDAGHTPTLVLGTHPSALPERTLREEPFDYVCQGEGPKTIATLLANWQANRAGLNTISGLWKKGATRPLTPPNIADLDRELPSQAWDLLDMPKYRAHNWHLWTAHVDVVESWGHHSKQSNIGRHCLGRYASVQTSLGCIFQCQFCCIQAPFGDSIPRMRFWAPTNIAAQIANLYHTYGISNIKVADEMFCLNKQHVHQICNLLIDMGLGPKLNIWAYARVDTVKDEQMLARMRQAGFRWLGIGIESGSKHVRDGVEKGRFGNEDIIQAVRRVQAAGICVGANYIFGLPDDTNESMQQTLDLACEINAEWANFYCAMAYPGSPLHRIAQERGWRLPEDPGGPGWIGYSQHSPETLPLPTETLRAGEVLAFRDEAFLHYFSHPAYQDMMRLKFGDSVVAEIQQMVALGKPKRLYYDI